MGKPACAQSLESNTGLCGLDSVIFNWPSNLRAIYEENTEIVFF